MNLKRRFMKHLPIMFGMIAIIVGMVVPATAQHDHHSSYGGHDRSQSGQNHSRLRFHQWPETRQLHYHQYGEPRTYGQYHRFDRVHHNYDGFGGSHRWQGSNHSSGYQFHHNYGTHRYGHDHY